MSVVVPTSLHSIQKSKIEQQKVRSEDELLKFFLHGSYDVQRGHVSTAVRNEITEQTNPTIDIDEDKIKKSRCMFEETYMINISVKKPDAKQIDVRIEKSSLEGEIPADKLAVGDDEISSIFDDDEIDKVMLNGINSTNEPTQTNLTLADMINKSLTTIPSSSVDNLNKISQTNHWFVQQKTEVKSRKISAESLPSKPVEGNPTKAPSSTPVRQPMLTANSKEDEKLYKYLDYLYTKEDKPKTQPQPQSQPKVPIPKQPPQPSPISIIDLEQLCRSLTVDDLKNELIRKKIYELKLLIDQQHQKPTIKPRRDTQPVLIAMPPVVTQRRQTVNHPNLNANYPAKQTFQRQNPPVNSTRKY